MSAGPYSIGSDHYPGMSKVIEEFGEALQVLGKVIGFGYAGEHWDGTDLRARLHEEIGDVKGALAFIEAEWALDADRIAARAEEKRALFDHWQWEQEPVPADVLAWVRETYSEPGQALWIDEWRKADTDWRTRMCALARIPDGGT